jgi:hypothetical protein
MINISDWSYYYQGGNMWGQYDCYLTAMRDVLGLDLPEHAKYAAWEQATIHGGFRFMHPDFCMVCDFPEILKKDDQNRPHSDAGPSHRWRDGWSLYHWHGVRVPAEWIEDRASLTAEIALGQENVELRRAACEILGWGNVLRALDCKTIHEDDDPQIGTLVEVRIDGAPARFLIVLCATGREFALPVPVEMQTARQANAWTYDLDENEYQPEARH